MAKKRDPDSQPAGEHQRILLERLDEMGVTMKTASREWLGRNHAYLRQYIFEGVPQYLDEPERVALSQFTGLTEDALGRRVIKFGDNEPPIKTVTFGRTKGELIVREPYGGPALVKTGHLILIYSGAEGGKGHVIISSDPIEEARPPEELIGVRDAYGIRVSGDSMFPAYKPGDVAWVHPHKQPKPGDDIVLYHLPNFADPEALIKVYLGETATEWRLRQYQPPLDFTESKTDWPVRHTIVGRRNA